MEEQDYSLKVCFVDHIEYKAYSFTGISWEVLVSLRAHCDLT